VVKGTCWHLRGASRIQTVARSGWCCSLSGFLECTFLGAHSAGGHFQIENIARARLTCIARSWTPLYREPISHTLIERTGLRLKKQWHGPLACLLCLPAAFPHASEVAALECMDCPTRQDHP